MKLRLLLSTALLGAALAPAASANMGCQALPESTMDPDVVQLACRTAVGLVPDELCDKYRLCFD